MARTDSPFVCELSDLEFGNDERYFKAADSADYLPLIAADAKTIQIDRKNKTIKVWTVWFSSYNFRQIMINGLGQYKDYNNYGYQKSLHIVNYSSMKAKDLIITHYNCDGSVIGTINGQNGWADITPGSVMEGITESIVKKYKLK